MILDNEFSQELKKALKKKNIDFQFVPHNEHRANAAERGIQTFKQHFLSTLATCDPDFPITEWDRLLEQSEMTLNMLQPVRCNPKVSAYAYLYGQHNFNAVPLAPLGTKIIVHVNPTVRASWEFHGKVGWYIGPAHNHYRCFKCWMPDSGKVIFTNTVKFIPKKKYISSNDNRNTTGESDRQNYSIVETPRIQQSSTFSPKTRHFAIFSKNFEIITTINNATDITQASHVWPKNMDTTSRTFTCHYKSEYSSRTEGAITTNRSEKKV